MPTRLNVEKAKEPMCTTLFVTGRFAIASWVQQNIARLKTHWC